MGGDRAAHVLRPAIAGVGLGFYIARDLTQRIGGTLTLTLTNRTPQGLRAEIVLLRGHSASHE